MSTGPLSHPLRGCDAAVTRMPPGARVPHQHTEECRLRPGHTPPVSSAVSTPAQPQPHRHKRRRRRATDSVPCYANPGMARGPGSACGHAASRRRSILRTRTLRRMHVPPGARVVGRPPDLVAGRCYSSRASSRVAGTRPRCDNARIQTRRCGVAGVNQRQGASQPN